MIKTTVKNIRATLFFRESVCKLLKNSECKKYIPYSSNNSGQLCFSGQAEVAQKS